MHQAGAFDDDDDDSNRVSSLRTPYAARVLALASEQRSTVLHLYFYSFCNKEVIDFVRCFYRIHYTYMYKHSGVSGCLLVAPRAPSMPPWSWVAHWCFLDGPGSWVSLGASWFCPSSVWGPGCSLHFSACKSAFVKT